VGTHVAHNSIKHTRRRDWGVVVVASSRFDAATSHRRCVSVQKCKR
jgi:hypothetical protein